MSVNLTISMTAPINPSISSALPTSISYSIDVLCLPTFSAPATHFSLENQIPAPRLLAFWPKELNTICWRICGVYRLRKTVRHSGRLTAHDCTIPYPRSCTALRNAFSEAVLTTRWFFPAGRHSFDTRLSLTSLAATS